MEEPRKKTAMQNATGKRTAPFAGERMSVMDDVEWCILSDVPRALKFPFPVKAIGHMVVSKAVFRSAPTGNGTEFCIRLASSDAFAEDRIGGRRYRTPFPHVMVKRPGVLQERHHAGWREAFFVIYSPAAERALLRTGVHGGPLAPPIWPIGNADGILESIRQIRALFPRKRESGVADELDALCWALVTRLVALRDSPAAVLTASGTPGADPSGDERIRAFSAALVGRCLRPIRFSEEARSLGFSRSSFYRRFKTVVGEPPERHLMNLRLEAAAELLSGSPLSIKQIAHAVHDKSAAHFSDAFRRRFGVSPREWRRNGGHFP